MIIAIVLILISEIWDLAGQLIFKKSAARFEDYRFKNIPSLLLFARKVLLIPEVWIGLFCVSAGIIIWFLALSWAELSIAYPLDSMEYLLTLGAARIFLKEKMDFNKILGTSLIVCGIVLISAS